MTLWMSCTRRLPTTATAIAASITFATAAHADDANPITRMSLEYLMNIEVTTVSKQPERVQNAPAAVYVLTREEIRRSGASTIPDALRLVPGVNVAQINANSWAVSIRGFNSRFANKLLVMIDGRSIYSPLFSGVFWDRHSVPIEEIDRIEVVRGPGGTLWGANAVNGVINIITRHSSETQGQQAEFSVGTEKAGGLSLRQGASINDEATYRLSAQFDGYNETKLPDGSGANDQWENGQANLRVDWTPTVDDEILIESGYSKVMAGDRHAQPSLSPPYSTFRDGDIDRYGAFVMGRWNHRLNEESDVSLQGFIDHRYMDIDTPMAEEYRTTADLQAQHGIKLGSKTNLTWGAGYRAVFSSVQTGDFSFNVDPEDENTSVYNVFAQASRRFFDDRVELTVGSKLEHHSVSGTEIQPSARALWNVTPRHAIWTAVSTAARTPSTVENMGTVRNIVVPPGTPTNPSPLPLIPAIEGDRDLDAERVTAYEAGYHGQVSETVSLDVAGFINSYTDLLLDSDVGSSNLNTNYGTPFIEVPVNINNKAEATTYGFEFSGLWQARDNWRLRAGYAWLHEDIEAPAGAEGNAPEHQLTLQSFYDIDENWRFDTVFRFVDDLENAGADAYLNMDARLSWTPKSSMEIALTGRNLLHSGYLEYGNERADTPLPAASEIERSVLLTMTMKF